MQRPDFFTLHNGEKAKLPFSDGEYEARLTKLRHAMQAEKLDAVVFTSMHNIAYYSGFLYCAFGRPYACVVTEDRCVTVSANIDLSQPWRRSYGENVIYTDWKRDNYIRAIQSLLPSVKKIGVEHDHLNLELFGKFQSVFDGVSFFDVSAAIMKLRMIKSAEEIVLITDGARTADIAGETIHAAIREGTREIDVAMAGRDAMELEIAKAHPESELRDSWVWFQSGINTDGAHNPVTTRQLEMGDILSLNAFPMISAYYTALERTLFLGEPDARSLEIWEANVAVHKRGLELIKPGTKCSDIVTELNELFASFDLLQCRTFGYGHSFGVLSHYYGREAGLELREDIDTVLEAGMVVSMEPMVTIPEGQAGAGGYREHDILVIGETGAENITKFPFGPEHNVIS
ncbi:MAG: aminopeptidase P family protein [Pseudomonadota bacterium]